MMMLLLLYSQFDITLFIFFGWYECRFVCKMPESPGSGEPDLTAGSDPGFGEVVSSVKEHGSRKSHGDSTGTEKSNGTTNVDGISSGSRTGEPISMTKTSNASTISMVSTTSGYKCGICESAPGDVGPRGKKVFFCGSCASYSTLGHRISVINVLTEVATLRSDINEVINNGLWYDKIDYKPMYPPIWKEDEGPEKEVDKDRHEIEKSSGISARSGTKLTNHNWTNLLVARLRDRQSHLQKVNEVIWTTKESIEVLNSRISQLKALNEERKNRITTARQQSTELYNKQKDCINEHISDRTESSRNLVASMDTLKTKLLRDVCSLFVIRKVRRRRDRLLKSVRDKKNEKKSNRPSLKTDRSHSTGKFPERIGVDHLESEVIRTEPADQKDEFQARSPPFAFSRQYDLVLGFNIVPDLSILAHYSHVTVNSALERLASLCHLLAYYLDIRLPYEITQTHTGYYRISRPGKEKLRLDITQPILSFAKDKHLEFEAYAEALAMLAINTAAILYSRGVHISLVEDIVQVNRTVALIAGIRLESSSERVHTLPSSTSPQNPAEGVPSSQQAVTTQPESFQHRAPQPQNRNSTTESFMPDLFSVKDYIVSQMYLDISGGSAEWNLIEKDAILDSVVDLSADQGGDNVSNAPTPNPIEIVPSTGSARVSPLNAPTLSHGL
ncbi:hypothetical protein AWJ20_2961 [Sugiyamaella lignohabitans]|uniref:Autophagy-related protein 14 n=1 Tax=Sugiyamaella lignohabitans TaxID=796027 RepID=A0A167FIC2_9ASCO|nr:uncharacterized protein AWJ20_2961 [Sugiyamaella lignohabitans]ANB15334.1 hypothetical protein AWJ20_2961 [Sugiyamaella lignohabitans]